MHNIGRYDKSTINPESRGYACIRDLNNNDDDDGDEDNRSERLETARETDGGGIYRAASGRTRCWLACY